MMATNSALKLGAGLAGPGSKSMASTISLGKGLVQRLI